MKAPLWQWVEDAEAARILTHAENPETKVLCCQVPDGQLHAIRINDAAGLWHLSVWHQMRRTRRKPRFPTWEELSHARTELLPANTVVALIMPVEDDTLHLHELRDNARPAGG